MAEQKEREVKATEVAQLTQDQIAEILREKGWAVQYEGGVVEALRKLDLARSLCTDGYILTYREPNYSIFSTTPVHAMFRLLIPGDVSLRTAAYYLYYGDEPHGVEPLEECDFAEVFCLDVDEDLGEMPFSLVIEGDDGLDLVRSRGFWSCELYSISPGEYYIRRDLTDPDVDVEDYEDYEAHTENACYYRVPDKRLQQLLEIRLPLGLPGETGAAYREMQSIVAAMEEEDRELRLRATERMEMDRRVEKLREEWASAGKGANFTPEA